jgi:hypothetical protein
MDRDWDKRGQGQEYKLTEKQKDIEMDMETKTDMDKFNVQKQECLTALS